MGGEDTPLLEKNPVSERREPSGTAAATNPFLEGASLDRDPLMAFGIWGEQSFYLSSTTGQPMSPDLGTVLTLNTTSRVDQATRRRTTESGRGPHGLGLNTATWRFLSQHTHIVLLTGSRDFLGSPVAKTPCLQGRARGFDPWSGD